MFPRISEEQKQAEVGLVLEKDEPAERQTHTDAHAQMQTHTQLCKETDTPTQAMTAAQ